VADSTAGYRAYSAAILRRLDLDRIRAEGYGFQIEMTYRAKQHGAAITEVPISFVDREAGESKMSSFIVVEALALVTWWALGRLARGVRRFGRKPNVGASAPATEAGTGTLGSHEASDDGGAEPHTLSAAEDPVRST